MNSQQAIATAIRQASPKTTRKIAQILKEFLREVNDRERGKEPA